MSLAAFGSAGLQPVMVPLALDAIFAQNPDVGDVNIADDCTTFSPGVLRDPVESSMSCSTHLHDTNLSNRPCASGVCIVDAEKRCESCKAARVRGQHDKFG